MMAKDLGPIAFSSVRFQSALVHCVAQNRSQHFSRSGHAILADSVAVKLQRQFDIAVAKQSLYGLWIGSDANRHASLRLHSPSDSDYRQIAGRRHFGRDSTVVIHSSGLKSVTTDNQERGALTSTSVATG